MCSVGVLHAVDAREHGEVAGDSYGDPTMI